jgi:hypothetical protein
VLGSGREAAPARGGGSAPGAGLAVDGVWLGASLGAVPGGEAAPRGSGAT